MKRKLSILLLLALVISLSLPVFAANLYDGNDLYLSSGGTITLQNDMSCAYPTLETDTIIDLNGHTLRGDVSTYSCATVTRVVDGKEVPLACLFIGGGGRCVIKNGTIENLWIFVGEMDVVFSNVTFRETDIFNGGHIEKLESCVFDLAPSVVGLSNSGTIDAITNPVVHSDTFKTAEEWLETVRSFSDGEFGAITTETNNVLPFTDVKPNDYYYLPVSWALENGVTTGKSETTFAPNASCTRGEVVTFLWRAMGKPEPKRADNPFTDIKTTDYYYKPVLWAVENDITNGTSDTVFSPSQVCSNAHILTFLYRAMGEPGKTGSGAWYQDAQNWASRQSLLENTGALTSMTANCPRSDVVTFLFRALDK